MKVENHASGATQSGTTPAPERVYAQSGDQLADVAQRHGVTPQALRAANPGVNEQLIAGQALQLPAHDADNGTAQDATTGAAVAVAAQSAYSVTQPVDPKARALEGFRFADGLQPGQAAPVGGFADAAQQALARRDLPSPWQSQVDDAFLRVGNGVLNDKIATGTNDKLTQDLHTVATRQPAATTDVATGHFEGAVSQVKRMGQIATTESLAAGSKVAYDVGAGNDTRPAGLPPIDATRHKQLDADLYYQKQTGELVIESVKYNPNTLAQSLKTHAAPKGSSSAVAPLAQTQIQRQQDWREAGATASPRNVRYVVHDEHQGGFANLTNPSNLKPLDKAIGDPQGRHVVVGEHAYSTNELREMGQAAQAKAVSSGDYAAFQARWEKAHPGETFRPNEFYKDVLDTPAKVKGYIGKDYGAPVAELPALAKPQIGNAVHGGGIGGAAGAVMSAAEVLRSGQLDAKGLKHVAAGTATGVAVGAVTARAEAAVAPMVDRAIGNGVQRAATSAAAKMAGTSAAEAASVGFATRTIATRLGGSTMVGAVVSAGFSAYDNRRGLARGDAQAIGQVAADTAVGASAVVVGTAAGAGAGVLAGMATGAAAGSVVPGVGTVVGGLVGGAAVLWTAHSSGAREAIASKAADAVNAVKSWF